MVHNRYQSRGGEDTVVDKEIELLKDAGHIIHLHEAFNTNPKSIRDKIRMSVQLFSNTRECDRLAQIIRLFQPDIVHFHNTFLTMGSSVFSVPNELGVPCCLTAHNYRIFCIAGTAFRNGQICVDCCGGTALSGARHACYKSDYAQSLILAAATEFHKRRESFDSLNAIAYLNSRQSELLNDHGVEKTKLIYKPNFVPEAEASDLPARTRLLMLGRLSTEKGLENLMNAYRSDFCLPLDIVGQGPLWQQLQEWAKNVPTVKAHGYVRITELENIWSRTKFLVFPSIWLEGQPMVVLEALSRGIPIIANRVNAGGAIAEESHGITYGGDRGTLSDALRRATSKTDEEYEEMSRKAREIHRNNFSPTVALPQLENFYEIAIQNFKEDSK